MKTDRFVKAMLVIIAGLLLLNCFKDNGGGISVPFLETKAKASVPAFIQKGNSYECYNPVTLYSMQKEGGDKIIQIDSDSGWIEAEGKTWGKRWINTAHLTGCKSNP